MLARAASFVVASALAVPAQDHHPAPFRWEKDLATATARAVETGRPVAAYFTFDT